MVNGVEKLLVFQLDSTAIADQSYFGLIEEYQLLGFEEYISIMGSTQNIFIYGNDQKTPQMIGFVAIPDSGVYAFYLTGLIDFTRIPQMITAFQENEFLNLSNFALDGRRKNTGNK